MTSRCDHANPFAKRQFQVGGRLDTCSVRFETCEEPSFGQNGGKTGDDEGGHNNLTECLLRGCDTPPDVCQSEQRQKGLDNDCNGSLAYIGAVSSVVSSSEDSVKYLRILRLMVENFPLDGL